MPIKNVWEPYYDLLPKSLYDGAFILVVNPTGEPRSKLYLFHDKTWFANAEHMLGWSREVVHSLTKLVAADWPHWLLGHAVRLQPDNSYQLSSSDQRCTSTWLIDKAKEAQILLAAADVKVDQWGHDNNDTWHEAISKELDIVTTSWESKFVRRAVGNDLVYHTMKNNESNGIHHTEYPPKKS